MIGQALRIGSEEHLFPYRCYCGRTSLPSLFPRNLDALWYVSLAPLPFIRFIIFNLALARVRKSSAEKRSPEFSIHWILE